MENLKPAAEAIQAADAILIGASNGLSITEGLHLFADNQAFQELFGDLRQKYGTADAPGGPGTKRRLCDHQVGRNLYRR